MYASIVFSKVKCSVLLTSFNVHVVTIDCSIAIWFLKYAESCLQNKSVWDVQVLCVTFSGLGWVGATLKGNCKIKLIIRERKNLRNKNLRLKEKPKLSTARKLSKNGCNIQKRLINH